MTSYKISTSLALIGLMAGLSIAQESNAKATAADSLSWVQQFKNSSNTPIGFAGFMTARVNNGNFFTEPAFSTAFNDRINPYGGLNLKMVANPHPMIKLSTVMNVGTNFNGLYRNNYSNRSAVTEGGMFHWDRAIDTLMYSDMNRSLYVHNNEREVATIAEEMLATADIRTPAFKVELQAGSALWIENSPLTIYRRDNRHKQAWYYEAYEPEYSSQTLYSYKLFNRIDWGGQPVWPRKTFGGISADFYELPAGFNAKFMVAEPMYIRPLEKRGNTMSDWGDREALTAVSNPGWLYSAHIGNSQIPGLYAVDPAKGKNSKLQLGGNVLWVDYYDDIITECTPSNFGPKCLAMTFRNGFSYLNTPKAINMLNHYNPADITSGGVTANKDFIYTATRAYTERPYYVEPKVFSVDLKGNVNAKHFTQAEIAMSKTDTTYFTPYYRGADLQWTSDLAQYDPATGLLVKDPAAREKYLPDSPQDQKFKVDKGGSKQDFAFYYKTFNENHFIPFMLELGYFGKDFNSPYSMTEYAVPVGADEFVVGTGTQQYHKNLMGFNVMLMPRRLNGYSRLTFGEYVQVKESQDVIRMQHNLIGRDLWKSTFSWSRFDPSMMFDQGNANNTPDRAMERVGNQLEGYKPEGFGQTQQGGYVGDDNQLWERYGIFDDVTGAAAKAQTEAATSFKDLENAVNESILDNKSFGIMSSKKGNGTIAYDFGYHLSPLLGLNQPLFVNVYAEANGVDKTVGIPFVKDKMFRDVYGLTELVWGVSSNFSIIGMLGVEFMKSSAYTLRNGIVGNGNAQSEDYLEREMNGNGYAGYIWENGAGAGALDSAYYYSKISTLPQYYYSQIDYQQLAAGVGFDWDFSSRAGFHFRYRFVKHTDNAVDAMNKKMEQWLATEKYADMSGSFDTPDAKLETARQKAVHSTWISPTSYSIGYLFAETKVWF